MISAFLLLPGEMRLVEIGFHKKNSVQHMHMHVGLPEYILSDGEEGKWKFT